jgi:tetratricopeptide (TPR) repeat protein
MVTIKNQALKFWVVACCSILLAACMPPGPKALLDGKRLLEKGRVPEAIERLRVATDLMATNAQAWNYLGVACHQDGRYTNAIAAYRRALALDPDLIEARLNLGCLWLETGRPADAKLEFTAYNLRRPNAPEGLQKLGLAELALHDLAQAEQHLRKAVQLDSDAAASWNTLGMVQLQRGHPSEAVQSFTAALQRHPEYAPSLLNLAIISQQNLGDRAAALKYYRRYLDLKPRPAGAEEVAVVVRQLEAELAPVRPVTAAPTNSAALAQATTLPRAAESNRANSRPVAAAPPAAPKSEPVQAKAPVATALAERPETARQAKAPTEAAAKPQPAAEPLADAKTEKHGLLQSINPANLFKHSAKTSAVATPPATTLPAPLETPPREVAKAEPVKVATAAGPQAGGSGVRYAYRGGGNTVPGDRKAAEAFATQGAQAFEQKRFSVAADAYRSAAKADPGWFQAHLNYAVAALAAGRTQESLAAGETALALQPDSVDARLNFALALKQGKYLIDSAAELEKLLLLKPNETRAHLSLGNLYADQLQQPEKARAHYLKLLEIDPTNPQASAIRFWLAAHPAK